MASHTRGCIDSPYLINGSPVSHYHEGGLSMTKFCYTAKLHSILMLYITVHVRRPLVHVLFLARAFAYSYGIGAVYSVHLLVIAHSVGLIPETRDFCYHIMQ